MDIGYMKSCIRKTLKGAGALKGEAGASAYEIAKRNGFEGTEAEWLENLKAVIGDEEFNTRLTAYLAEQDKLKNKKVLVIGDSIMAGDGWTGGYANLIAENHPNTEITNIAVSGATLIQNDANKYIYVQFKNYYQPDSETHGEEPDLILFDGGGNDCMYRAEIGAVSENCGIDGHMGTMCDALEYLIYAIKTYYPHSKLIYVTTPLAKNWGVETVPSVPSYKVQLEYDNARRVVLEKWGIPIADIRREGNLTGCIESQTSIYYADGLHFNEVGYRYTHHVIEATIDKIF